MKKIFPIARKTAIAVVMVLLLGGCEEIKRVWKEVMEEQTLKETSTLSASYQQFLGYYLSSAQTYTDELQVSIGSLQKTIQAFIDNPDQQNLDEARKQWIRSYYRFQTGTLFYRFAENFPGISTTLYQIDAPVTMPGYIDYLEHYPHSGIVNDEAIELNLATLKEQHGLTDTEEVSLGFAAIAFLLWGENGNRAPDDYVMIFDWEGEASDLPVEQHSNNRRRLYLQLLLQQLQADVELFAGSWQAGGGVHEQLSKADNKHVIQIVVSLINATREPRSRQAGVAETITGPKLHTLKTAAMLEGMNQLVRGESPEDGQMSFLQLTDDIAEDDIYKLVSELDLLGQLVTFDKTAGTVPEEDILPENAIKAFASLEQSYYRIAGKLGIHL